MHKIETLHKIPRILIEQDAYPVLLNFKRQMLGLSFHKQILPTNPRCIHYCRNRKRIINEDNILYIQYYKNVGSFGHLEVLKQVPLKNTLPNSLHGEAGKHPGISKMMERTRQKKTNSHQL